MAKEDWYYPPARSYWERLGMTVPARGMPRDEPLTPVGYKQPEIGVARLRGDDNTTITITSGGRLVVRDEGGAPILVLDAYTVREVLPRFLHRALGRSPE